MTQDMDEAKGYLERRVHSLELAIMHTRKRLAIILQHFPNRYDVLKEELSVLRDELKDVLRNAGR